MNNEAEEIQPTYSGPMDGAKIVRLADELLSLSAAESAVLKRLMESVVNSLAEFER